jgi:glutaredoxin 3
MVEVVIYTKDHCPYCVRAKELLKQKGVVFEETDVTHNVEGQREMVKRSGRKAVPQIFIAGEAIGGCPI